MTSKQPTKAGLQEAVAKLTEENAALRDLIAAVHEITQAAPVAASRDDRDKAYDRMRHLFIVTGVTCDPQAPWTRDWTTGRAADHLRDQATSPLDYEPYRDPEPDEEPEEGVIVRDEDIPSVVARYAGHALATQHDCEAADDRGHPCTGRLLHPLPHRTADGYEFGEDAPVSPLDIQQGDVNALGRQYCHAVSVQGAECYQAPGHEGPHRSPMGTEWPGSDLETCPRITVDGTRCTRWPGHPGQHEVPGWQWYSGDPARDGGSVLATPDDEEEAGLCDSRPFPAGSEGDDGTRCVLPKGHDGDHDDGVPDGGEETCPRLNAHGSRCERYPGHPGSHHADGADFTSLDSWKGGGPLFAPPTAAEVAASHKGARS